MDDHNHPHHQPFMISTDLRHLINGRPPHHFQPILQAPPDLFPPHRPASLHHYDLMHQMVGRNLGELLPNALHDFHGADSMAAVPPPSAAATPRGVAAAFDCDSSGFGGDNGSGRWPRQETLTLLEIRSRLDSKFKEANQKGPLWDEVSRIMFEEHGFQRSGKKCREKFENLYKYYKKTKEGKAGRQDGKHYRFFRQLEALCGDTAAQPVSVPESYTPAMAADDKDGFIPTFYNSTTSNPNSLSLSAEAEADPNSSEFESSSSDGSLSEKERKRRGSSSSGKSYWKAKIKRFIDQQMGKLVDRQEAWLEKLTCTLEKKEEERRLREEEWRQQEAARTERERRFWARERAWMEARDTALVEALQNLTGKVVLPARASFDPDQEEEEAAARNSADHETATATDCVDAKESGKKRKGNSRSTSTSGNCHYGQDHQQIERVHGSSTDQGVSAANDSCFPFLMAHGYQNLWENYGLKMNKGEN